MHAYTPTPTNPTTIPVVDDGDPPTAANLMAAAKANADAIATRAPTNSPSFTGTPAIPSGTTLQIQSGGVEDILTGGRLKVETGGVIEVKSGGVLEIDLGGDLQLVGTIDMTDGRSRIAYPDPLTPADAAIISFDPSQSDTVILPHPALSGRVCKVLDATAALAPIEGMRVVVELGANNAYGAAWTIRTEGGATIAILGCDDLVTTVGGTYWNSTTSTAGTGVGGGTALPFPSWVELQYRGGVWKGRRAAGYVQIGAGW